MKLLITATYPNLIPDTSNSAPGSEDVAKALRVNFNSLNDFRADENWLWSAKRHSLTVEFDLNLPDQKDRAGWYVDSFTDMAFYLFPEAGNPTIAFAFVPAE